MQAARATTLVHHKRWSCPFSSNPLMTISSSPPFCTMILQPYTPCFVPDVNYSSATAAELIPVNHLPSDVWRAACNKQHDAMKVGSTHPCFDFQGLEYHKLQVTALYTCAISLLAGSANFRLAGDRTLIQINLVEG